VTANGFGRFAIARAQFAFTIDYHILWPAYSIGISGFIVVLNLLWFGSRQPVYRALLRFRIQLFALGFAMTVVTGVVLSYDGASDHHRTGAAVLALASAH
jgi:cytochrome bd-type quinol oxidase subunit 1